MPWAKAANDDGTFKSVDELKQLYGGVGVNGDKPIIAYCRIGERSSHPGLCSSICSGTQREELRRLVDRWGNLVGAPVEKP